MAGGVPGFVPFEPSAPALGSAAGSNGDVRPFHSFRRPS